MSEREHYLPIYQVRFGPAPTMVEPAGRQCADVYAALCGQHCHERAGEGDEEGERCAVIGKSGWQEVEQLDVRTAVVLMHQFKVSKMNDLPSPRICRTRPA